jgi:hypothetical protein
MRDIKTIKKPSVSLNLTLKWVNIQIPTRLVKIFVRMSHAEWKLQCPLEIRIRICKYKNFLVSLISAFKV